jgi:WD40 repeat protein
MKPINLSFIALTVTLMGCGSEPKKDPPHVEAPPKDKKLANPLDGLATKEGAILKRNEGTHALAFSPDGKILASGGYQNIVLWDLTNGTQMGSLEGDKGSERDAGIVFSPDGKTLAASSERGPIKIWDIETKKEKGKIQPLGFHGQLCFSADGKKLFGNETRCWDVASGKDINPLLIKQRRSVYSPGGECVATSEGYGPVVVTVLELPSGKKISEFPKSQGIAVGVSMPAKRVLCRDEETKKLSVWDFTGKKIADLDGLLNTQCHEVAISHDGKYLVADIEDKKYRGFLKVWDFINGKELNPIHKNLVFKGEDAPGNLDFYSVAFSKDGKLLAVGSDQEIIVWSTDTVIAK